MKKTVYIALAIVLAFSLTACGSGSDADRSDNTKDGIIGDGLDDIGDDIRDAADDIGDDLTGRDKNDRTGNNDGSVGSSSGNVGSGTNGSNMTGSGAVGGGVNGANGSTANRSYGGNDMAARSVR